MADVRSGELSSIEVNLDKVTKNEKYKGKIDLVKIGNKVYLGFEGQLVSTNKFEVKINPMKDVHTQLSDLGYDVAKSLEIKKIYYDHDHNKLKEESINTLKNIVIFMDKYKQTKINVNSRTDSNGSLKHNNKLFKDIFDKVLSLCLLKIWI